MAKYSGYVYIPHSSYDEWRNSVNGNGYDVDLSYGCQCWDLAAEFWWNIGFPQGYPLLYNSSVYTMWERRNENSSYNGTTYFDIITDLTQVKRGDVMVFNYTSYNPYGHVGFADVDYNNWIPSSSQPYEFPILSENNGGTPDPSGGAYTNIHGYDIRLFIGAFRYKTWHDSPVPPTPTLNRSHFPWVLYSKKLRERK